MQRRAFSLVELLIVVLIIGIVYTLAVSSFAKVSEESNQITLKSLREFLQSLPHEKSVKLLCLGDCSSCSVLVDGEVDEELKGTFDNFLDDSIEVYRYDFYQGLQKITQEVYFNSEDVEEDVCFSYTLDKKGVGDQVFIKFNRKVYDYTSYFGKTTVYSSLEEIVEARENLNIEILR